MCYIACFCRLFFIDCFFVACFLSLAFLIQALKSCSSDQTVSRSSDPPMPHISCHVFNAVSNSAAFPLLTGKYSVSDNIFSAGILPVLLYSRPTPSHIPRHPPVWNRYTQAFHTRRRPQSSPYQIYSPVSFAILITHSFQSLTDPMGTSNSPSAATHPAAAHPDTTILSLSSSQGFHMPPLQCCP